jgi:hypothetical protein
LRLSSNAASECCPRQRHSQQGPKRHELKVSHGSLPHFFWGVGAQMEAGGPARATIVFGAVWHVNAEGR